MFLEQIGNYPGWSKGDERVGEEEERKGNEREKWKGNGRVKVIEIGMNSCFNSIY